MLTVASKKNQNNHLQNGHYIHCVKSVQIRIFYLVRISLYSDWLRRFTYFPVFGLNSDLWGKFSRSDAHTLLERLSFSWFNWAIQPLLQCLKLNRNIFKKHKVNKKRKILFFVIMAVNCHRGEFFCAIKFSLQEHDKTILINCSYDNWLWYLYKFKNNYVQTNYTHKVVKVVS